MVKKLILCMLVMLLAASVVMVGCTEAEVKWELEIWSGKAGAGSVYVTTFAIADALTKNHPDIRASCAESLGGFDNVYFTEEFSLDRKKNLIFGFPYASFNIARDGIEPWVDKAYDIRAIGTYVIGAGVLLTLDPNITEAADLAGKKVGNYPPGSVVSALIDGLMYGALGADWEDEVTMEYMSPSTLTSAFLDGLVDAMLGVISYIPSTDSWMATGPTVTAIATKGTAVHTITYTESEYQASFDYAHQVMDTVTIPADTLYEGSSEFQALGSAIVTYCCWPEADEDLVYEFTKYLYENATTIQAYGGAAASATEKYMTYACEEATTHPGAVKFYKEKGLM